jgi:HPt (histidine-containing phosphotransfer) domain-containing protein
MWTIVSHYDATLEQKIDIDGKVGEVWNQTDRASQLLPRLEAQLN